MHKKWLLNASIAAMAIVLPVSPQATRPGGHDVFPYTHATAVRACSPAGIPMLRLFFTEAPLSASLEPAPPYIRMELPSGPEEIIPAGTYVLETPQPALKPAQGGFRVGRAALAAVGQPPVWLSGTLAVNSMAPGRYLNGHFRVEMPDGKIAESGFLARYVPGQPGCGF